MTDTIRLGSSKLYSLNAANSSGTSLHLFALVNTSASVNATFSTLQVRAFLVFDSAASLPFGVVSFAVNAHSASRSWSVNNSVSGVRALTQVDQFLVDPTDSRLAIVVAGVRSVSISVDVAFGDLPTTPTTPWLVVAVHGVEVDPDEALSCVPDEGVQTLRAGDATSSCVLSTTSHHEVCSLPFTVDDNGTRLYDSTITARAWLAFTPLLPAANQTSQASLPLIRISEGGSSGRIAAMSCGDGVTVVANDLSVTVIDNPTSALVVDGVVNIGDLALSLGFWPQSVVPFDASAVFVDVRSSSSSPDRPRVAPRTTLRQGDDVLVFDPVSAHEWLNDVQIFGVCSDDAHAQLAQNQFLLNSACFLAANPSLRINVTVDVPSPRIVRLSGFFARCNFSSFMQHGRGTVFTAVWPNRSGGVTLPAFLTVMSEKTDAIVQFPQQQTTLPTATATSATDTPSQRQSSSTATVDNATCAGAAGSSISFNPADPVIIGVGAVLLLCFLGSGFFAGFVWATRRSLRRAYQPVLME
jgi:hypothetical protein